MRVIVKAVGSSQAVLPAGDPQRWVSEKACKINNGIEAEPS